MGGLVRADAAGPGSGRPYFFLSHARAPRHESESAGPDASPVGARVGFLDQGIALGTRWTDELSKNLARCQGFVPLSLP